MVHYLQVWRCIYWCEIRLSSEIYLRGHEPVFQKINVPVFAKLILVFVQMPVFGQEWVRELSPLFQRFPSIYRRLSRTSIIFSIILLKTEIYNMIIVLYTVEAPTELQSSKCRPYHVKENSICRTLAKSDCVRTARVMLAMNMPPTDCLGIISVTKEHCHRKCGSSSFQCLC
jgi:hypothetical protein